MTHKQTVALVTGGGKGVGAGIACMLCKAGARVCIGYHSSEAIAQKTLEDILSQGGEAFLYKADVSHRPQIRAMAEATAERYGGIDVLVNNAAMQINRFIREYDADTFRWLWDINIGGYWRATQECLPYLKQSAAPRIVNISSIHGKRPGVFDAGYSMTKGAIRMFTREAALELASLGITVNAIDLGACKIDSKTGQHAYKIYWPIEVRGNAGLPLSNISTPEDVGALVLYLTSPDAGMMTGSGIRLDAGMALA
ncbi:MAG: SDR family oxidoreductase [Clostridia bacterium]|nr:SDR family oxidoreductase [Clostridia bacterium]